MSMVFNLPVPTSLSVNTYTGNNNAIFKLTAKNNFIKIFLIMTRSNHYNDYETANAYLMNKSKEKNVKPYLPDS